mmetsp:Transcript_54990/g.128591  ORF Transcript_54990/g.128591 Transcript_54990/m.128591 type:complete len:311 (+) Transcript_54990:136-1068(+)
MSGVVGCMPSTPPGLDWPLSLEEKKNCLLQLFSKDVQVANEVIRSGEVKLRELELELQKAVDGSGVEEHTKQPVEQEPMQDDVAPPDLQPVHDESTSAAEKLRQAIASATAALEALEQAQECKPQKDDCDRPETLARSRSESNLVGILCKDTAKIVPRSASAGHRQRRVSFGPSDCDDSLLHERGEEPEPEMFADCTTRKKLPKEGWCPSITPLVLPSFIDPQLRGREQRSTTPRSREGGVAQKRSGSGDGRSQYRGADTRRSSGGNRSSGRGGPEQAARPASQGRAIEAATAPSGEGARPKRVWRSRGT